MENYRIQIVPGCNPIISAAIENLQDRWRQYSNRSKSKPLAGLLEEIIDPALSEYAKKIPRNYLPYILGSGQDGPLSEIFRTKPVGAELAQRNLIREFENASSNPAFSNPAFVATLETLVELLWACSDKRARHTKVRGLNGQRRAQEFCRFCGKPSELAAYAAGSDSVDIYHKSTTLQLSSTHCHEHRVKLPTGKWNPAYKSASMSVAKFDLELDRLTRQSRNYETPSASSGDPLVDQYIYQYVHRFGFRPGDKAEMRNHARGIVDAKLSDHKKRVLVLQQQGLNQSNIATILNVSRQSVSKSLASTPEKFLAISASSSHHPGFNDGFRTKIRDIEPSIMDWLDDPNITDIMLNPDGRLWLTRENRSKAELGTIIESSQAKLIIAIFAAEAQISPDAGQTLECELPGLLRLVAWLTPIVESPTFAIRKMAQ
ncbi:LuxR family transcriptional regulator [Alcanivorax profundi]|uniref:LuxR family transcriptional regulator n=1 Tax=Alcanivorax profundi TaxID=2338368 RepID=UPI0032B15318